MRHLVDGRTSTRDAHPEVPWKEIVDMHNIFDPRLYPDVVLDRARPLSSCCMDSQREAANP